MISRLKAIPRAYVLGLMAALSLSHFAYWVIETQWIDTRDWNRIACLLKNDRHLVSRDCLFTREKYYLFTRAELESGQSLFCRPPSDFRPETVTAKSLGQVSTNECHTWTPPHRIPEIGWDAYRTWYGRALIIYQETLLRGRNFLEVLRDTHLEDGFSSTYYRKYPWAVSIFYSMPMLLLQTANPLLLQIIQVSVFLVFIFLLRRQWPQAPRALWLSAAFIPIAGRFLTHLYADHYLLTLLLAGFHGLNQRRWKFFGLFFWLLVPWVKSEGWVHLLAVAWVWWWQNDRERRITLSKAIGGALLVVSILLQWGRAARFDLPHDFAPLGIRLLDFQTYSLRLPLILRYYADVFFRPMLWGLWWPFVMGVFFWRGHRKALLWLPLFGLWAIIPLAFLIFPDGAYREVVLTGSNRALWQCLALSWILIQSAWPSQEISDTKSPTL